MTLRSTRPHIVPVLLFALILSLFPVQVQAGGGITIPTLDEFIEIVHNGEEDSLRGVYVPEMFAHSVVPQPEANPAFISVDTNVLTQFSLASKVGSTGLLAHNYLAGRNFSKVKEGQVFYLVYGNGRTEMYIVTQILHFQALDPNSVWSMFMDLRNDSLISSADLFSKVYGQPDKVILQTCISARGEVSWGRLFVIAEPYTVPVIDVNSGPVSRK